MEERIACPQCGNPCVPPRGGGAYRCPACHGLLQPPRAGSGARVLGARGVQQGARPRSCRAAVPVGLAALGILLALAPRLARRPPSAALDPAFGPPFGLASEGAASPGDGSPAHGPAVTVARLQERLRGLEEDAAREPEAVDLWVNLVGMRLALARQDGGTATGAGRNEVVRARRALARLDAATRGSPERSVFAWWRDEVEAFAHGKPHEPVSDPVTSLPGPPSSRRDAGDGPGRANAPAVGPRARAQNWQQLLAAQRPRRAEQAAEARLRVRDWEAQRRRQQQAAVADREREIARRPDRAWPYLQLGRALLAGVQDPYLGAGEFPDDAIAIGPGPTSNALPDYSPYRRDIERATRAYRRAAVLARTREHRVWAYIRLSDAYGMLRRPELAKEALEKASRLQPENPLVWARLAAVYSRLGQHANMAEATKRRAETEEITWSYAAFLF